MPGVQNGLYTFSPINSVYGSRVTDNIYTVDGVNFNDPQVQSAVTDIPYDDIQEVQVSTSGQFAEFGSASGGVFNFITKSGGNQLRGLASLYGQNKRFASNNISTELAAIGIRPTVLDHDYEAGGNLGGPIKRDRLWFFGSYYRQNQERSQSDFPVPIETTQWTRPGKVDGQINQENRFGIYYNYRDRYFFPWNGSFQVAGDPRTWQAIGYLNHLLGLSWTMVPDSRTVVQVRGGIDLVRPAEHRAEHRSRHAGLHREHDGCGDWRRQRRPPAWRSAIATSSEPTSRGFVSGAPAARTI